MNKSPLISIIIPCFNHGEFIEETLQSIQKADASLYELVIVNDGSTDAETIEKFKELESKGIKILHQQNGGQSVARNHGIRETTAPYILPVDSDNKIHPELLTAGIEILTNNPHVDVVYTDAIMFGEINGIKSDIPFNFQRMLVENYIDTCAVIRRTAFERVGGYDPEIQGIEDWDLWLKMAFSGSVFHYIRKPLYEYRYRKNSFIRKDPSFNRMMKARLQSKHPDKLDFEFLEDRAFLVFDLAPLQLLIKWVLRKYFPAYYRKLVQKGKIHPYA